MAVTVVSNLTTLYDAESSTNWSSGSTYSGWQREGSYCLGEAVSEGSGHFYKTISSTDLSNTHIYSWMMIWGGIDTEANGGFRIVVGDGTNTIAYYVGGSDNYGFQVGGWSCFVLNTASPPTNYTVIAGSESSLNWSAITQIGVGFNVTSKIVGNSDNVMWDICRYGTGLTIKGGTSTDKGTFSEIAAEDASTASGKAYGIIREIQSGVFGVQGQLKFGDDSGTTDTYFEDKNVTVIFEDRPVASTHYKLTVVGNSTGTNSFILGEKSGSVGIKGCIIKSAGAVKVDLDFSDTNVNELKLYGNTFIDVGTTILPASATDKECLSCTWDSSGKVTVDTLTVKYCKFIAADDDAITVSSTTFNVTDCDFIAPTNHGVELTTAGTYTFDNLKFSGTDGVSNYDIENTTSGSITINATNGANPNYYDNSGGGTTIINNAVTLSVHVEDTNGNPIEDAACYIQKSTPDVYTSVATGNDAGDGDFVVQETITADTPASGWIKVQEDAVNKEQMYRYTSWSGSTFTLPAEVTNSCTGGGTSTLLQDSINDFTTMNIRVGDTVRNTTDGSWATVLEIIDAHNITTTELTGGTNNVWTSGDTYSFHRLALTYDGTDTITVPLMQDFTDSSGNASTTYNYLADKNIDIVVRKSPSTGTKYVPVRTSGTITSSGFSVNINMVRDDIA